MRISDWSSDVCSSDLSIALVALAQVRVSVARVADYLQSNRTTATPNQHSVPPANQVRGRACGRFRCPVVACALCGKFRLVRPSGPQAGDRVLYCLERKRTRLNSSNKCATRMPSPATKKKKNKT